MLHKSNDCRICEPPILPTRWIYLLHTSNNVRCGGKLFVGNSGALHTGIALLNVLRTDVSFGCGAKSNISTIKISPQLLLGGVFVSSIPTLTILKFVFLLANSSSIVFV